MVSVSCLHPLSVAAQPTGLSEDIQNFELLSNLLPRSFWGQTSEDGGRRLATVFATESP